MSPRDEDFDAQLADRGDDRPGLDDLLGNDYSTLQASLEVDDDDDDLDDDDDDLDDDDDDEDEDDDIDDDDDDDDDDYPDDAEDDEIDLVVGMYREEGRPATLPLSKALANDFDELVTELRRMPGDGGALGAVSIDSDFFVLVRVRGRHVQVVLSDSFAANDWPIARDAADFLGVEIPDEEDDSDAVGDLDMLADLGLSEMELEAICNDLDSDAEDLLQQIAEKLAFGASYGKAVAQFDL